MNDVTTLFDDLVAIRRAESVLDVDASQAIRSDLKVLIKRIEGKLIVALSWLSEDEREEVIESIDDLYEGGRGKTLRSSLREGRCDY